MAKKGSFFDGLFFGGIIGSVCGVLFTPLTGKEAREKFANKLTDLKNKPAEIKSEIIDPALDAIEKGISKIDIALEEARAAMDEKRKELEKEENLSGN